MAKEQNGNFEAQLFKAADKLRKNIDAAEYKNVALGLIFLKYISESFAELYDKLAQDEFSDPEDRDEYKAENIFFVPEQARWKNLQAKAKLPTIGQELDDAMESIEKENPELRNVLPKVFGKPNLDKTSLGQLIDLISNTELKATSESSKDLFGRVYEYFLGEFANAEGKKGGQFYTPKSIVKLMVEMIEPYKGRVYDPACGSGGMFVMSEKFVQEHQGNIKDITIYGQESNQTTWKLSKMNLAIRNINSQFVAWNTEGSFLKDAHPDLKADYILANPPFNQSDWGQEILQDDARWKYGVPPAGNANFAWMQHMLYHLATNGVMATVLANGSLGSNTSGEGEIRKNLIQNDLVECIVALPDKLFYNTGISACIWFLRREKKNRNNEVLFIDASNMGTIKDRVHRELEIEDISKIKNTYHNWYKNNNYQDEVNFCKSVSIEDIEKHLFILSPSNYTTELNTKDILESIEKNIPIINKYLKDTTRLGENIDKLIINGLSEFLPNFNWDNINFNSNDALEELSKMLFLKEVARYMDESEIPNNWEKSCLSNIANYLNGLALQKYPPNDDGEFLPVVKIKELKSGITDQSDRASKDLDDKYIVNNGDVLFSWSGSLEVVLWKYGKGALNQHLFKVTSENYPKWFYYFWTLYYLPKFRSIAAYKATTMGHIQRKHLDEAIVLIPDSILFEKLNTLFNPILDRIILNNTQLKDLF